jgi:hypothetical protein
MNDQERIALILFHAERARSYSGVNWRVKDTLLSQIIRLAQPAHLEGQSEIVSGARQLLTELDSMRLDPLHPLAIHARPLRDALADPQDAARAYEKPAEIPATGYAVNKLI